MSDKGRTGDVISAVVLAFAILVVVSGFVVMGFLTGHVRAQYESCTSMGGIGVDSGDNVVCLNPDAVIGGNK